MQLRDVDPSGDTFTVLSNIVFAPTAQENQIILRLSHVAGADAITAQFDLLASGVFSRRLTFSPQGDIFNGEDWTRAEFFADAPNPTVSFLSGIYGTLSIDQTGFWTYGLNNGSTLVQALGRNDTVQDIFTVDANDGHGGVGQKTITVDVHGANDAPAIAGDLGFTVVNGGTVVLTTLDFTGVDVDTNDQLTFTVTDPTHGHVALVGAPNTTITSFTQAQLAGGQVVFVHDGNPLSEATFKVTLSDGLVSTAPTTILGFVPTVSIAVKTASGMSFQNDGIIEAIGGGTLVPGGLNTFTILNAGANLDLVFQGSGFQYSGGAVTGGTISFFQVLTHSPQTLLAEFTGNIDAAGFYSNAVAQFNGDERAFENFSANWTFNFIGGDGNDVSPSDDGNDVFKMSGGNDILNGEFGFDRVNYTAATLGPILVDLANGIVTKYGNTAKTVVAGTDTLRSVEFVTGTKFADTFVATNFSSSTQNSGSLVTGNTDGSSNEFEGRDGNDLIFGNGNTRVSYLHATGGVTVDLQAGIADGNASVGHDTFTSVNRVRGSEFADTVLGGDPVNGESFEGRGGDDTINGRGGFDRSTYLLEDHAVSVHLAAGKVVGGVNTGTDTLISVEAVSGTDFADVFNAGVDNDPVYGSAVAYGVAGAANVGSLGTFNEFEGAGGDDQIIGNGNTRVAFYNATSGVVVDLAAGTSIGASTGTDTMSGVNAARGSEFNDILLGNGGGNTLEGRGGNDVLDGRGGNDILNGGTGSDIFAFGSGADGIGDFNRGEGDRIDLRAFAGITGIGNLTFTAGTVTNNVFTPGAGGPDTNITGFGGPNTLTLVGVTSASFVASDFIFHNQVAITVQTASGWDFGTLYADMAGSAPVLGTSTHIFAANLAKGVTFEMIGTGFTFNGPGGTVDGGTITEIDYLDTTNLADPVAAAMQAHVLVNTNGWNISAPSMFNAIFEYQSATPAVHAQGIADLNAIFNGYSYSAVGTSGDERIDFLPDLGEDVFISGNLADVFNGMQGPFGPFNPGSDTVDYSLAGAGVTASLLSPASNLGAAAGDIYISIENFRGSIFTDTLIGDGNNNILEGGPLGDTLNGGGGTDTASYLHAAAGVTANLTNPGSNTGDAAGDSYSSIENLRGSAFADTLTGNGTSALEGGAGGDHLIGQSGGMDIASYERAPSGVTVNLANSTQNLGTDALGDTFTFINNVFGSRFDDHITGNNNNNVIDGGFGGTDQFTGLGGADTFVFHGGQLTITDFHAAENDLIDISTLNGGNSLTPAQLTALISASTGSELSLGDNNVIDLTGVNVQTLTASSFILSH